MPSDQTGVAARCYSLSSSPHDGGPLTVTVKRTVDGYASNWICDNLSVGDTMRALPPAGIFTPASLDADLLLFAGGSGVTPIMSITRTALDEGKGKIVVFYANRDETSVIFAEEFTRLAAAESRAPAGRPLARVGPGPADAEQIKAFAAAHRSYDAFVCGPAPYMKMVTTALRELEFPRDRRHQEKFVSLGGNPFGDSWTSRRTPRRRSPTRSPTTRTPPPSPAGPAARSRSRSSSTARSYTFDDWDPKTKLLDFLESKGVKAPYSCREGECSACAIRLLEGEVRMLHNDVLDDEDLADGIRLGCQSLPVTDTVKVTYS